MLNEASGVGSMILGLRNSILRSLEQFTRSSTERRIREWKDSWRQGAEAKWSGTSSEAKPTATVSATAGAWMAGWTWAERHQDRRQPKAFGLAHPHRRSTDTLPELMRHAKAGVVGVSALTLLAGLWEIRRRRGRVD